MITDYIFQYQDSQGIEYPTLKFIQLCQNKLFGIFHPYGSQHQVELEVARVSLNTDGMHLGKVYSALGGTVVDCWNDVVTFHQKFGLDYDGPPRLLDEKLLKFRNDFIDEEHAEFKKANTDNARLDAICDLIYVLLGYARLRGWNFPEAWRRVQQKNMEKMPATDADIKSGKARHASDIIKPEGWTAPDHTDLTLL